MTIANTSLLPVQARRLSAAGLALIRQFEGCRLAAYRPTPQDVPTIGWGATRNAGGAAVRMGQLWTQAEADARLAADTAAVAAQVAHALGAAPAAQAEFDALVVFAYNVGIGALGSSTLLRLHKAGDHAGAAAQFARWNKQGATTLPGLTHRRAAEAALYRSAAA